MDCAVEESEIRQALEPIAGIRSLGFQLGARTLRIDAAPEAYPTALAAIRKAGFDPKPLSVAGSKEGSEGAEEAHDHEHGFSGGVWRMVLALVFAIGAEIVSYFAPETTAWKVGGMAVAGLVIGLAGLDTYKGSVALAGKLGVRLC
jgi:Cd2+/Zn2+-exporting ATPase